MVYALLLWTGAALAAPSLDCDFTKMVPRPALPVANVRPDPAQPKSETQQLWETVARGPNSGQERKAWLEKVRKELLRSARGKNTPEYLKKAALNLVSAPVQSPDAARPVLNTLQVLTELDRDSRQSVVLPPTQHALALALEVVPKISARNSFPRNKELLAGVLATQTSPDPSRDTRLDILPILSKIAHRPDALEITGSPIGIAQSFFESCRGLRQSNPRYEKEMKKSVSSLQLFFSKQIQTFERSARRFPQLAENDLKVALTLAQARAELSLYLKNQSQPHQVDDHVQKVKTLQNQLAALRLRPRLPLH